jgi:hypothetical protein
LGLKLSACVLYGGLISIPDDILWLSILFHIKEQVDYFHDKNCDDKMMIICKVAKEINIYSKCQMILTKV